MSKRKTFEEFEADARKIHGDKYIYHKPYIDCKTNMRITCPIHGDFPMTPNNHLRGQVCPKCSVNAKWTTDKFIKLANEIHKGRYTYDKSVYNGIYEK